MRLICTYSSINSSKISHEIMHCWQLDVEDVVHCYQHDTRRLLVLGYNATLTVATEAPRGLPKSTFDQMQARAAPWVRQGARSLPQRDNTIAPEMLAAAEIQHHRPTLVCVGLRHFVMSICVAFMVTRIHQCSCWRRRR